LKLGGIGQTVLTGNKTVKKVPGGSEDTGLCIKGRALGPFY